jgi:ubiquinone/menaquinone biosynthesis C-methylase UbiE
MSADSGERTPIDRHFDRVAGSYARLRGDDEYVAAVTAALASGIPLAGRRVLDIGCGAGNVASMLARRYDAHVVGIDSSRAMVAEARRRLPPGSSVQVARAEQLPFESGSFDAAVASMSVQHFDRPRAFAESFRVLVPGGSFAIATTDPDGPPFWAERFFPSFRSLVRKRFPTEAALRDDLASAGFGDLFCERVLLDRRYDRETALAKLRLRAYSIFALMGDEEFRCGLRRALEDLEDAVRSTVRLIVFSAKKPRQS